MRRIRQFFFIFIGAIFAASIVIVCQSPTNLSVASTNEAIEVMSPNGEIKVNVELSEQSRPYYRVKVAGETIIAPSPLGFKFENAEPLVDNFAITGITKRSADSTWNPVWGTDAEIRNNYNELVIGLQEKSYLERELELVFRAYNDGVGFRYRLPEQPNLQEFNITSEETYFQFTEDYESWWIPANYDSYERIYQNTPISTIAEEKYEDPGTGAEMVEFADYAEPYAVNTPITLRNRDGSLYLSLHEADLTDYAGMTLKAQQDQPYTFKSHLVPWANSNIKVKAQTPHVTPWRTITIADNPAGLIESHLILNLNEPSKLADTTWIEPMKYIGIWWGMHIGKYTWKREGEGVHGATTERAKRYIDFAAEHDIDAVLIEGWNTGWESWGEANAFSFTQAYPDFDIQDVVNYAEALGVEIMGHHETGGDVVNYERQMEDAFDFYDDLGIHVVKTGYADEIRPDGQHHHGQFMVNHYRDVVKLAAKHQTTLNVHEPIKPTGIERTYPNMMTREGVRGMEYNASTTMQGNPPEHTLVIPFTRMLAGPLDDTPGIFELNDYQPDNRVSTTLAKQLANMVILYSPLQMASDLPENYIGEPALEFIERVPVNWDESQVLKGEIGEYITIARRQGESWYLGSTTNAEARTLEIPLDFLESGRTYVAHLFEDTPESDYLKNPEAYQINRYLVTAEDVLKADLASSGGQAVILDPATEADKVEYPVYDSGGISF
jgi:alpha-glucosidase